MGSLILMTEDYRELQKIVGNILDTPGKGGNISVKSGNDILVKASGEDLKVKHKTALFRNDKFIQQIYIKNKKFKVSDEYIKPTMEFGFHKVIKAKYVVHYHPVYVLPFLCVQNYMLKDKYSDVIETSLPGEDLENKIKNYFKKSEKQEGVLLLKNHGVILFSNSIENIKILHEHVKHKYFRYLEVKENYTPDDVVDKESFELLLFRNAIQNISNKFQLEIQELSKDMVQSLLDDENEKYRQQKMKG